MNRTPPTTEQLITFGRQILDSARQELLATRTLMPSIFLIDAMDDTPMQVIKVQSANDNDACKDVLSKDVRKRIAKHGFTTVVTLFDTFEMKLNPGTAREAKALKVKLGLTLKDLAAAGFGTVVDCVKLTIQTMTSCHELILVYRRDDQANVKEFDEVTERKLNLAANDSFTGRFSFFGSD